MKTTAFEYVEKSKSRAFLDLLALTEIRPSVEVTNKLSLLLEKESKLLTKLRKMQAKHREPRRIFLGIDDVEKSVQRLNHLYNEIEEVDPEYVSLRRAKTASFQDILTLLSEQDRNMILVEYYVIRDKTFVFILSPRQRRLQVISAPLSSKKASFYLKKYWREVVEYNRFEDTAETWEALGKDIIEPLQNFLVKGDIIYFVPNGLLHYFPLHALKMNGESLIRQHPVVYLPSSSLMRFFKNKGYGNMRSCASFGVAFEEESSRVAQLFDSEPYNGYMATKEKVVQNSIEKDILHFSCHGYFDEINPLSSGIELFNGEILSVREIFEMRLKSELVVLSACHTGVNQRRPGDELIGLARAFMYAGVPSVVVSLWSVNALSTRDLMIEFYNLLRSGKDKATALQQAQIKIMEKKEYSHPYFWAPFTLVGKWK